MKVLVLFTVLLNLAFAQAQTYSSQIITNDTMLVHGAIGDYPITMFIEQVGFCEYEREYEGWYKYDSSSESIPILFYYSSFPEDEEFKIYAKYDGDFETVVDEDYACRVTAYDEVFQTSSKSGVFNGLTWQKNGSVKQLSVSFDSDVQDKFWQLGEQDVFLTKDEAIILDLGALGFSWAYELTVLGNKTIGDVTHLLIDIIEPSKPGGNGRGMCGAGDEGYILYIRLDQLNKLLYSDSAHVYSCFQEIDESAFTYDAAHPERGIIRN